MKGKLPQGTIVTLVLSNDLLDSKSDVMSVSEHPETVNALDFKVGQNSTLA